jgi:NAD-dependent SIR2 family protein deacetylase
MMDNIEFKDKIKHFARFLDQADAVLVGAGSGLSVDAGIDYLDSTSFAEKYPVMLQYGFTNNAELMGFDQTPHPGLFWGYYLVHGNNMRFGSSEQSVHKRLLDLTGMKKEYFVITTNVDAFFQRNGFDEKKSIRLRAITAVSNA